MKRRSVLHRSWYAGLLILIMLAGTTACGNKGDLDESRTRERQESVPEDESVSENEATAAPTVVPEVGKIREICELVVVECDYHNVAKSKKAPGIGPEHIGEKERTFWIEYTGKAQVYYRADKIEIEQDGTELTIILPRPSVSCTVDENSWNEDSYVISQDQWIQKNPITAEDQTKAVSLAQAEMVGKIRSNSSLMNTAKMQLQELVRNYVDQIGDATGVQYHITWKSVTDNG